MKVNKHPTSQPTPRLIIEGGTGVAPPYLAVAKNVPVDCKIMRLSICPAMRCFPNYRKYNYNFSITIKYLVENGVNLEERNKRSSHHCKSIPCIKSRATPLKWIRNIYPADNNTTYKLNVVNSTSPLRVNRDAKSKILEETRVNFKSTSKQRIYNLNIESHQ